MQIIPSIVTAELADLAVKISAMEGLTPALQVDIFDREFVPGHESVAPAALSPWASKFELLAHLLVYSPEAYLDRIAEAGFTGAIFHLGTTGTPTEFIREARRRSLWVGLTLNLDTQLEEAEPFIGEVDEIVFWAVHREHPGTLDPVVYDKIRRWRQNFVSGAMNRPPISVDGGATFENIAAIAATGADRVYTGTAIFNGADPARNYQELHTLAEN